MNISPLVNAAYIAELCESAAHEIYGERKPTIQYANAVADQLLGTIAHESAMFQYTRQHGFSWERDSGAWGICQCEEGSVTDSMQLLRRNTPLAKRLAVWLAGDKDATLDWLLKMPIPTILRLLPISDRLAVAFCRLHYFRVKDPIPYDMASQDRYYKRFYNTSAGSARLGDFTRALKAAKELIS